MDIPLDEVIHFDAISSASTGAAVDADSTPTFAVYEEATDTDIGVGGNLTKRTSLTGNYRGSFTASAANGFEVGKWYNVIGSATIGAIACKGVLKSFRIVAAEAIAGKPKVDVDALLGTAWLTPGTAGTPDVNAKLIGATAQTGRDIGASVLLSSGTGTGQLDFTSGVVKSNWVQYLGTALGGTAAQVVASITKFFNVAAPTGTVNSLPDAVPGAASGVAIVGSAMTLTSGERTTLANTLEAAILNEGDATALLAAIAAKVEEFLINEGDATATIAAIATACNAAIAAGAVGTNAATAATQATAANAAVGSGTHGNAALKAIIDTKASQTTVDGIPAAVRDVNNTAPAADSLGAHAKGANDNASSADDKLTTVLARIGAFTGTGVNTILGFLKAMFSKSATLPSDVGGTADPAADSLEAISEAAGGGGGGLTPENIQDIADATAVQVASVVNGISGETNNTPIADGGKLQLRLGNDYLTTDGRQRSFTVTGVPADWSTGTGTLRLRSKGQSADDIEAVSLAYSSGTLTVSFDVAAADVSDLRPTDAGQWAVFVDPDSGGHITPIKGVLEIDAEIPASA